jgi:hypothetical protein
MADDTSLPHPTPAATAPVPYAPKVAEINAEAERKRQDEAAAAMRGDLKYSPTKAAEKTPDTAKTRLRGFEDAHFGRDATRINGEVERGIGSRYGSMSPTKAAEYAALEELVKAETAIAAASHDLADANMKHEAALKRLAAAQKASTDAAAEAKRIADEDAKLAKAPAPALTPVS